MNAKVRPALVASKLGSGSLLPSKSVPVALKGTRRRKSKARKGYDTIAAILSRGPLGGASAEVIPATAYAPERIVVRVVVRVVVRGREPVVVRRGGS